MDAEKEGVFLTQKYSKSKREECVKMTGVGNTVKKKKKTGKSVTEMESSQYQWPGVPPRVGGNHLALSLLLQRSTPVVFGPVLVLQ